MRVPTTLWALVLLGMVAGAAPAQQQDPVDAWLDDELDDLVGVYRHLHENPEVTYREVETSKRVAAELAEARAVVTRQVGGLGVVGVVENGPGPRVLLRADMDALPVGERTGLPYASKIRVEHEDGRVEGVMHACGHDVHMTSLIGATRFLADHRDRWSGTLVLIGQPAEERGAGARAMLDDGLFERFGRPDFAFALHVTPDLPPGTIGLRPGPMMANVDSVDITMFGRGGHGAAPHLTIDPIVQASQLVLQLQTIVSRELNPIEPAVVTVGSIHAGTKHNIISDRCALQLTVRSLTDEARAKLHAAIRRKAGAVAASAGAPEPKIEFSEGTPSLANDPELTARVDRVLRATFGAERVVAVEQAMVGEDFAHFGREGVPSVMFRLGTVSEKRRRDYAKQPGGAPGLHSGYYWPDAQESIAAGVRAFTAIVEDVCAK